jgi:hypothetical protein
VGRKTVKSTLYGCRSSLLGMDVSFVLRLTWVCDKGCHFTPGWCMVSSRLFVHGFVLPSTKIIWTPLYRKCLRGENNNQQFNTICYKVRNLHVSLLFLSLNKYMLLMKDVSCKRVRLHTFLMPVSSPRAYRRLIVSSLQWSLFLSLHLSSSLFFVFTLKD